MQPFELVQLTDPHLFADPKGRLAGITTRTSFDRVLDQVLEHTPRPDLLVVTGDLTQDESLTGYRYLRQALDGTGIPYRCLPGNHDRLDLMRTGISKESADSLQVAALGGWRLLLLDSSHRFSAGGILPEALLEQVHEQLRAHSEPTIIFTHHQPAAIGCDWLDQIGIANGKRLLALADAAQQVKALAFGHIHQEFAARRKHYRLLGTPATCVQFRPLSHCFALDSALPGYRTFSLDQSGQLHTAVVRLAAYAESPLLEVAGY